MYIARVFSTDGVSTPRRWASHTPTGPIEAETSAAISILPGVLGTIIADSRMTIDVHDRWPIIIVVGSLAQVSTIAMATECSSISQSPASALASADPEEWLSQR